MDEQKLSLYDIIKNYPQFRIYLLIKEIPCLSDITNEIIIIECTIIDDLRYGVINPILHDITTIIDNDFSVLDNIVYGDNNQFMKYNKNYLSKLIREKQCCDFEISNYDVVYDILSVIEWRLSKHFISKNNLTDGNIIIIAFDDRITNSNAKVRHVFSKLLTNANKSFLNDNIYIIFGVYNSDMQSVDEMEEDIDFIRKHLIGKSLNDVINYYKIRHQIPSNKSDTIDQLNIEGD